MSPESLKAYHAENPAPEQEIADLRSRLQTAEQQLADAQKEFGRIQGTSAKQVVDRFLDLMRKLNEKDLPAGFESWEAYGKHIDGIKQRAVAAEQQLGQVREEVKRERELSEEALGWALSLIASEDSYWSNSNGYLMAERVLTVLQERLGKPVQLPSRASSELRLSRILSAHTLSATPSDGCGKGNGGVMSYGPFRERIKALASELRTAGFEYSADCVAVADFDCPDRSPEEEQPPTPPHDKP